MRKLSFVLLTAAGLALVAGVAAAPALAQVRLDLNFGPPSYSQPYYGQPYYGYNSRPSYAPYYYQQYPNRGYYNTYNPYPYQYSDPYHRRTYPGYYER